MISSHPTKVAAYKRDRLDMATYESNKYATLVNSRNFGKQYLKAGDYGCKSNKISAPRLSRFPLFGSINRAHVSMSAITSHIGEE